MRVDLTEVAEQTSPSALGTVGIVTDLLELFARDALFFRVGFLGNEGRLLSDIPRAVEQEAFTGQSVPPGPARFLVIAFDVLGQIVMDDETDIGFVDAHAEGDRRADDPHLIPQECILIVRTFFGGQPSMVGQRLDAVLSQFGRH